MKEIYKRLGIESNLKEAEEIFKNKMLNKIFNLEDLKYHFSNSLIFQICNSLGLEYPFILPIPSISFIFNRNLTLSRFLLRLQVLIEYMYVETKDTTHPYNVLVNIIEDAFQESIFDLGYEIKNHKNKPALIYKKGANLLDNKLVLDVLDWLEKYPEVYEKYSNALKFFLEKKYSTSLTNCYSALESLTKEILNTKQAFDNDEIRNKLTTELGLDKEWRKVLLHYSRVAHEYSDRHGGNKSIDCNEIHTEFYLYQTGSYLRLILKIVEGRGE